MAFTGPLVSLGRPLWGPRLRSTVSPTYVRGPSGAAAGKSFIHQIVIEVLQASVTCVPWQGLSVRSGAETLEGGRPTLPGRVPMPFRVRRLLNGVFKGGGVIRLTEVEGSVPASQGRAETRR